MNNMDWRWSCVGRHQVFFITAIVIGLYASQQAHAVIEQGMSIGFRDFAVLPDSGSGNDAPARANLMTADPLGRMFVNDQRGPLYSVSADGSTVTNYLDLSTFAGMNLTTSSEKGFQSFAFHPDFATPATTGFGKIYTIHSSSNTFPAPTYPFMSNSGFGSDNSHDTVLLEWSVNNPNAATYAAGGGGAPREVLRLEQPRSNHNAGLVAFNTSIDPGHADYGNLYVAIGDGGSGNDPWEISEDPSKPYGKIWRIDPIDPVGAATYGIVADNVFASDGNAGTLAEVYAYGLRNPQRFGWDDSTGNLYAADIGQNAFEEINIITNGGNYGWDNEEGNSSQSNPRLVDPIATYNHTVGGDVPLIPGANESARAITMGEVVRDSAIPALNGLLLSGNFPTGAALYIDVSSGPPAERSGVDPFAELVLIDVDGTGLPVDLLEIINDTRAANGISSSSRADLRWSRGIDGRVFLTNKKDGVIRELINTLPGDFNDNGMVDAADYTVWRDNLGATDESSLKGNGDGQNGVDAEDYALWKSNFGNTSGSGSLTAPVPEPATCGLLLIAVLNLLTDRRRR